MKEPSVPGIDKQEKQAHKIYSGNLWPLVNMCCLIHKARAVFRDVNHSKMFEGEGRNHPVFFVFLDLLYDRAWI